MGIIYIPDLRMPDEEEREIVIWKQRYLYYLKQYRMVHTLISLQAADWALTLPI